MKGVIYMYTSPSGKSYIGQTTQSLYERAGANGVGYKGSGCFYSAIKEYGFKNFTSIILEEVEADDIITLHNILNEKEIYWIAEKQTQNPNGYNLAPGGSSRPILEAERLKLSRERTGAGNPMYGHHWSAEERAKISARGKKFRHTEESKALISMALSGKPKSEAHKKALSEHHANFKKENHPSWGKKRTEESKALMREAAKHKKYPCVCKICGNRFDGNSPNHSICPNCKNK